MNNPVKTYDYCDADGGLLYQNCRFEPKDFRPRRSDGNGGYIWNLEDVKRVLYRLPQLIETPTQEWTYICEGEKDADRLADMGLVATTSGSSTSWKKDYNEYFKDRLVAVCPDNDTAGKIFADKVSESLYGTAAEIRVLELPGLLDGEDVSDWMDNGGDILLLEEVLKDTKPYVYIEPADIEPVLISLDSVKPVAVDWLWEKRIPKAAITALVGQPGAGKTTSSMGIASTVTTGNPWPGETVHRTPGNVILMSAEDSLHDVLVPKLIAAGADVSRIKSMPLVTERDEDGRQQETHFDISQHAIALESAITQTDAVLVIIDPVTAYMGRADSHKNAEVRGVLSRLKAIAEKTGAAIVCISHFNKNSSQSASNRIVGSIAFNAVARAVASSITKNTVHLTSLRPTRSSMVKKSQAANTSQ